MNQKGNFQNKKECSCFVIFNFIDSRVWTDVYTIEVFLYSLEGTKIEMSKNLAEKMELSPKQILMQKKHIYIVNTKFCQTIKKIRF